MPLLLGEDENADSGCQGDIRACLPLPPLLHHTCSNGGTHRAGWMRTSFKINGSLYMGNRRCHQGSGPGGGGGKEISL